VDDDDAVATSGRSGGGGGGGAASTAGGGYSCIVVLVVVVAVVGGCGATDDDNDVVVVVTVLVGVGLDVRFVSDIGTTRGRRMAAFLLPIWLSPTTTTSQHKNQIVLRKNKTCLSLIHTVSM
jgi:hypothetical protein